MKKGISLIVLVITIIVMIILATSVMISLNNTGVINKADEAVGKTNFAQVQQYASLVWSEEYLNNKRGDQLKEDVLDRLDEYKDKYDFEITDNGINVTEKGEGSGAATTPAIDWNAIVADANANPEKYRHPDQTTSTAIAIGTDGQPVNMDLWVFVKLPISGDISLRLNAGSTACQAYVGELVDGAIIGKVPQYIKAATETEFLPVKNMDYSFATMGLKVAPEIPTTVTSMSCTFANCRSLKTPPPVIPESVTFMSSTFAMCIPLTGEMVIDANITTTSGIFTGAAQSYTGAELKLSGKCPILSDIVASKDASSNIVLK